MSTVFPIETKPRYAKYTATAGQTLFDIPFEFQQTRDIKIRYQPVAGGDPVSLTETTDYTVAGAGEYQGGSFSLVAGATEGDVYEVWGAAVIDRTSSVVQSGAFKSKTHDDEHDRHRIIQQELSRDASRALKLPMGAVAPDVAALVGGKVLGTNDAGTQIIMLEKGDAGFGIPGDGTVGNLQLIDQSVGFGKLGDTAHDWLKAFSALPGNSAAANDANLLSMETVFSGALIDGRKREIPVSAPPSKNTYRNTIWSIDNFDGTMTAGVPSDPDMIPTSATQVKASGAEDGWPQGNCQHAFGTNRAARINTVKRNHGNEPTSICMQQGVVKTNRIDWLEVMPLLGPGDKLDETDGAETAASYGYDAYGFVLIGDAVAAIPVAKKFDGSTVTWHLMRRHLGKIYAGTTADIETEDGSEDIRIYHADREICAWEGQEGIEISGAPVFNGINVNDDWKLQQRTPTYSVYRRMTPNGDLADTDGKGDGAGVWRMRIKATSLEELTFPGGEILGAAYVTFTPSGITAAPSVVHGGRQISSTASNGTAIFGVTGGTPSPGHAVIQGLLDSEASFQAVVKYEDADVVTDHTEPAPIVHSSGKVFTVLRTNDDATPSVFCVAPNVSSQPVCTPLPFAGTAEESPWFPEIVDTPEGERIFFGFSGDRTPQEEHYGVRTQIPMFLMTALVDEVSDGSVSAFRQYKVYDADWSGELNNQAALFQMGGLCYIPRLNALLTQFSEAYSTGSGEYASSMNTLLIGLDHWNPVIRREPLRPGRAPGVGKWRLTYGGLSAAIASGEYFKPQNVLHDAVSRNYDPASGYFFSDQDGEIEIKINPYYDESLSGSGAEQWLELVDENDVRHPETTRIAYFRAGTGASRPESFETVRMFVYAGQKWRLKLMGTGADIQAGVDRNTLQVRGGT